MSVQKTIITIPTEIQVNVLVQCDFIYVHADWELFFSGKHFLIPHFLKKYIKEGTV